MSVLSSISVPLNLPTKYLHLILTHSLFFFIFSTTSCGPPEYGDLGHNRYYWICRNSIRDHEAEEAGGPRLSVPKGQCIAQHSGLGGSKSSTGYQ